mmetsp:Transcript_13183/g.32044  ORF Transcript_13183/g.32044 Transcript_13183/m.32044 type:complete len:281 (+) Transcript_13183:308-1150(+)
MFRKTFTAVVSTMTATGEATPWWHGVPTKLVKKTTLIPGEATIEALSAHSTANLPVHTLTFEIPSEEDSSSLTGKAKQHDTVRIELGDIVKMVIPGYKPKSYSMSALRDNEFDVTIKVYPNGRASGFLDRLNIGDTIQSFGMHKGKTRQPGSFVGLVAYGVGITEAWPIAKAELNGNDAKKVVLLWASRTKSDTFWNEEIEEYQEKYPDKFQLVNIYSREQVPECFHGRISPKVLADVFNGGADANIALFLCVGTKSMMRLTDQMFNDIGYPMPQHALLV